MKLSFAIPFVSAGMFLASASLAETAVPPAPTGATDPPPPTAPAAPSTEAFPANAQKKGVRMQDGFYLSFALGAGYLHDELEENTLIFRDISGQAQGASIAGELTLGGALKPGLILGGGLFSETVTDPEVEINGATVAEDIEEGTLFMLGPFIEWYPKPGKGFYIRGALAAARITTESSDGGNADDDPIGAAALFSLGYNWWVADQWSLGIQGRLVGAALVGDVFNHSVTAGSVMFKVNFN